MHLHVLEKGTMHVIVGCMASGKSEELMRLMRRAPFAKLGVIAFNHVKDPASRDGVIRSRDGSDYASVTVRESFEILQHVKQEHDLIGVNEAQFFDPGIVQVANALVDMGRHVILAGLDTDYRGEPFGAIPQLLAVADEVTKAKAYCVKCRRPASRTQMLMKPPTDPNDPAYTSNKSYEARCRSCHNPNP